MSGLRLWSEFLETIEPQLLKDEKFEDFSTIEGLRKQYEFIMENEEKQGQVMMFLSVDAERSALPFKSKVVEIYKGRVIE